MATLIGPENRQYSIPFASLEILGPSTVKRRLIGATSETIGRMGPSPKPGVSMLLETFQFLVQGEGGVDSVYPENLPNLIGQAKECGTAAQCLEKLGNSGYYGLLRHPFLPPLIHDVPLEYSNYSNGEIVLESGRQPRKAKIHSIRISGPGVESGSGFIWAASVDSISEDSTDFFWLWRSGEGPTQALRLPHAAHSSIDRVEAADLDRDGRSEILVETTTFYGDGKFSEVHVLGGEPDSAHVRYVNLDISGISGEPGGAEVNGTWWVSPPVLFSAYAGKANDETDSERTHDLRIDAFSYSRDGGLSRLPDSAFDFVLYGMPGDRDSASAHRSRMEPGCEAADDCSLRILPRLAGGELLWQVGAMATGEVSIQSLVSRWKSGSLFKAEAGSD